MLDSYAGHVQKTFCFCSHNSTYLHFDIDWFVLSWNKNYAYIAFHRCPSCFRVFFSHSQHSTWPLIPSKEEEAEQEKCFFFILTSICKHRFIHRSTLLKIQSKPMFVVHIWTTDMQFIWLRHAGKWPMMIMMMMPMKNHVYFQQIWYAADDTVCIRYWHRNRKYVYILQFNW